MRIIDNLISVGTITGTHRLLGTVKLKTSFSLISEIIGFDVILKKDNDMNVQKISNVKGMTDKRVLIDFESIKNMDNAKEYIGYNVYIRKDLVPDYEEELSLIGFKVYDKNEYIGDVIDILETAAHDILIINNDTDEIMVPMVDEFIKKIDEKEKCINTELIEGMR